MILNFVVFSNSFKALLAIHLADFVSCFLIFLAKAIAFLFKFLFFFPICLKAQFTAFFTKFLSSIEYFSIKSKYLIKSLSFKFFDLKAKQAIKVKAVRLIYSFWFLVYSCIFLSTKGVWQNKFMHTPSQMPQESNSETHLSICFSLTLSTISTMLASILAS
ncbi:MAG: hypothetical protein WC483_05190 [Candidatus Paceibacterota bacterium]